MWLAFMTSLFSLFQKQFFFSLQVRKQSKPLITHLIIFKPILL